MVACYWCKRQFEERFGWYCGPHIFCDLWCGKAYGRMLRRSPKNRVRIFRSVSRFV